MPQRPEIEQLLEHRDFLRALACQLVADPGAQDDLVSDALEEGVLRPPRHEALRPWLVRVLHNRAKNRQRDTVRREQRERRAARPEGLPSASEVAAHFELSEQLARRVQQLPDAYREVVLFRYYENLPPRAIAQSLGIPVETVKTRLRRALEQLRESLDRDHGSREKWLTALGPLTLPSLTTASVGITLGGTLLMSTKTLAPLVLVPLLGLIAWYSFPGPADKGVLEEGPDAVMARESAKSISDVTAKTIDDPNPAPKTPARLPVAVPELETQSCVLRGRCVDTTGKPIQGCEVSVRPSLSQEQREAAKSHNHLDPIPPTSTGEDGRFELRFFLIEDATYRLELEAQGHADYHGTLTDLKRWKIRELGQIPMLAGARVRGRVLDDLGQPVEGCRIYVAMDHLMAAELVGAETPVNPSITQSAQTDSMGRFEMREAICAGAWELHVDRAMISPEVLHIPKDRGAVDIEIRVQRLEDTDQIRGLILDADKRPIPGARVEYLPRSFLGTTRVGIYSQKNGSFRILRTKRDTGVPIRLRIVKAGFNLLDSSNPVAGGRHDLRLILTRGTALVIHASDAETRKPIKAFGIRIRPLSTGRMSSEEKLTQHRGRHENGILQIQGMAQGRYEIRVLPDGDHLESPWKEVELTGQEGAPLVFGLHKAVQQHVRVLTAKGKPVAGTTIELLQPDQGQLIDEETFVNRPGTMTSNANQAQLWTQGKTDATGSLLLTGPPARDLGLRIRGPGHVPMCVNGIRLESKGEAITVEVKTGAILVGRIRPLNALQALDGLGAQVAKARRQGGAELFWKAGLKLMRKSPPGAYPAGWETRFQIAEDGRFRIAGIAPGTWTLQLVWIRGSDGNYGVERLYLQTLTSLQDGEERELEFDISHCLLGETKGAVLWNGNPVEGGTIRLEARKDSLPQGFPKSISLSAPIDGKGNFAAKLIPATYDCSVRLRIKGGGFPSLYPTDGVLRVTPGGKHQIRLRVNTAMLSLRLENHDGNPLPGLRACLLADGSTSLFYLSASDIDGKVTKLVPTGSFRLLLPPKHLTTSKGTKAFRNTHGKNYEAAYQQALIPLATLKFVMGGKPPLCEITIPKSAGY